jgi:hypothetical protein
MLRSHAKAGRPSGVDFDVADIDGDMIFFGMEAKKVYLSS